MAGAKQMTFFCRHASPPSGLYTKFLATHRGRVVIPGEWTSLKTSDPLGSRSALVRTPIMNDYEVGAIRSLERRDVKSVTIIAMTANAFKEDVETAKASGMNNHPSKPIEWEKIQKTLAFHLCDNDNGFPPEGERVFLLEELSCYKNVTSLTTGVCAEGL